MRTVTIPMEEYVELLTDSEKLSRLEAAGVDNWDGYCYMHDGDYGDFPNLDDWIKNLKEEIEYHP